MIVTVLIPTYRRPDDLRRCLASLAVQDRPADEIVVVARPDDDGTASVLTEWQGKLPIRPATVRQPGVVAAMNAGWNAGHGDVVAMTDDDSASHRGWVARIAEAFASDIELGALGGRDLLGGETQAGTTDVGRLTWFGKMIGNHHLGEGPARSVDFLKGVNLAVRRAAVTAPPFDTRLYGQGAQVHWELMLCLSLKRRGWSLRYDPALLVDHHPAVRHDADQRSGFNEVAEVDRVHNETLALLSHLGPAQRLIYNAYMSLIGTRENAGMLQAIRLLLRGDTLAWQRYQTNGRGRRLGRKTWRETQHIEAAQGCVPQPNCGTAQETGGHHPVASSSPSAIT